VVVHSVDQICLFTIVRDPFVEGRQQEGHDVVGGGVEGRGPSPASHRQPLRLRQGPGQEPVGQAPEPLPRERPRHGPRPPHEAPRREQQQPLGEPPPGYSFSSYARCVDPIRSLLSWLLFLMIRLGGFLAGRPGRPPHASDVTRDRCWFLSQKLSSLLGACVCRESWVLCARRSCDVKIHHA
jgi:hypothetical protein